MKSSCQHTHRLDDDGKEEKKWMKVPTCVQLWLIIRHRACWQSLQLRLHVARAGSVGGKHK